MKTEFIVRGYFATSEEDNFEDGCFGETKTEFLNASQWDCKADTLDNLIDSLKNEFKCEDVMLNSCGEAGRIDIQAHQRRPFLIGKLSDATQQKFSNGDINLFLTCYSFKVEIMQTGMDLRNYTVVKYDSEDVID